MLTIQDIVFDPFYAAAQQNGSISFHRELYAFMGIRVGEWLHCSDPENILLRVGKPIQALKLSSTEFEILAQNINAVVVKVQEIPLKMICPLTHQVRPYDPDNLINANLHLKVGGCNVDMVLCRSLYAAPSSQYVWLTQQAYRRLGLQSGEVMKIRGQSYEVRTALLGDILAYRAIPPEYQVFLSNNRHKLFSLEKGQVEQDRNQHLAEQATATLLGILQERAVPLAAKIYCNDTILTTLDCALPSWNITAQGQDLGQSFTGAINTLLQTIETDVEKLTAQLRPLLLLKEV